jgi:hypothetical protein
MENHRQCYWPGLVTSSHGGSGACERRSSSIVAAVTSLFREYSRDATTVGFLYLQPALADRLT